jgi:hypothetical protein
MSCVWKHFCYCPCTAHCIRNQQVCSAGNIEKHQTSHFALGFGSGKMLQWMKCTWFWLYLCWLALWKSLHSAVHSVLSRDFTSGKTQADDQIHEFCRQQYAKWISRTFETFQNFSVIEHLNNKFQTLYLPKQNTAVDESLTLWKGHLSFGQYIPLKAAKFRIKTYELCESSSGYVWSFLVYTGKGMELANQFVRAETNTTEQL